MNKQIIQRQYESFLASHPLHCPLIAGHRWVYLEAGRGAGLVLLPGGFGVASSSWRYIEALAPHYRVVALHYPPTICSMAALCDGLVLLFDLLGLERAYVLGGSASGAVAQVLVRRHPERVAGLILAQSGPPQLQRATAARCCAALIATLPPAVSRMALCLAMLAFLPLPTASHGFWRGHFMQIIRGESRAGLANRFRLLADYDRHYRFAPGDLANWPSRIALIESTADGLITPAERNALRALYPGAYCYRLPAGHGVSLHQPDEQIRLIKQFLGPIPADPPARAVAGQKYR